MGLLQEFFKRDYYKDTQVNDEDEKQHQFSDDEPKFIDSDDDNDNDDNDDEAGNTIIVTGSDPLPHHWRAPTIRNVDAVTDTHDGRPPTMMNVDALTFVNHWHPPRTYAHPGRHIEDMTHAHPNRRVEEIRREEEEESGQDSRVDWLMAWIRSITTNRLPMSDELRAWGELIATIHSLQESRLVDPESWEGEIFVRARRDATARYENLAAELNIFFRPATVRLQSGTPAPTEDLKDEPEEDEPEEDMPELEWQQRR